MVHTVIRQSLRLPLFAHQGVTRHQGTTHHELALHRARRIDRFTETCAGLRSWAGGSARHRSAFSLLMLRSRGLGATPQAILPVLADIGRLEDGGWLSAGYLTDDGVMVMLLAAFELRSALLCETSRRFVPFDKQRRTRHPCEMGMHHVENF